MPVAIEKIAVLRATRPPPGGAGAAGSSGRGFGAGGQGRYSTALRGALRDCVSVPRHDDMANIHSQKKRILRSERERLENRRYTSAIKTYFRRLEEAVAGRRPATTRPMPSTASSSARSTRPSSAARCTATPALARSPARRACAHRAPPARASSAHAGRGRPQVALSPRRSLRSPARERVLVQPGERRAAGRRAALPRASRARGRRARRAPGAAGRDRCAATSATNRSAALAGMRSPRSDLGHRLARLQARDAIASASRRRWAIR